MDKWTETQKHTLSTACCKQGHQNFYGVISLSLPQWERVTQKLALPTADTWYPHLQTNHWGWILLLSFPRPWIAWAIDWHHDLWHWMTLNHPRSRSQNFHIKYLEYHERYNVRHNGSQIGNHQWASDWHHDLCSTRCLRCEVSKWQHATNVIHCFITTCLHYPW